VNIKLVVGKIKSTPMKIRTSPVVKATVQSFGQDMLGTVGVDSTFNMKNPRVTKFLSDFGGNRLTKVTKTTQKRVGKILARAVDEGKTVDEMAAIIADKFDQWSEGRAFSIAVTELTRASNFGDLEGMMQAEVEKKEWLATIDAVTRDTHEELDGEVVDIDEPFTGGAMYPGDFGDPAEDVNCRCSILPVIGKARLRVTWRSVESKRKPWLRKLRTAFARGFGDQKAAVLAALKE